MRAHSKSLQVEGFSLGINKARRTMRAHSGGTGVHRTEESKTPGCGADARPTRVLWTPPNPSPETAPVVRPAKLFSLAEINMPYRAGSVAASLLNELCALAR